MKKILFHFTLVFLAAAGFSCAGDLDRFSRYSIPPEAVTEAGCPDGTTVCVRDLFYNTPARMKFMKKDSAEGAAASGVVTQLALSHPDVSFKLLRDGQEILHTPGDGQLLSAIYAALGRDFAAGLMPVSGSGGAVRVEGFVFAGAHILLCAFNLLPIPPLDGSHALNLAVSALFGPLVGDAVAALAGVLCSLALLGGVVYLYVQTRGGALVIFAALALLLSALKELRLARRAIKV